MGRLEDLVISNSTLEALPVEPDEGRSHMPHQVRGYVFSHCAPTPLRQPTLVAASQPALDLLGLDASEVQREEFAQLMVGNRVLPGMVPAAHCYCGYQFGNFAGQLGDGAAILLGEVRPASGGAPWELQLKGSGLTPFSRSADGRKVLRSSIREFLASEALFHLGIPTTRAGSVVTSEDRVQRDLLYTGHPVMERCSVVSRIAPSFLRFGSFEICKPSDPSTGRGGPSHGLEAELLPRMLDHTIRAYFPDIWRAHLGDTLRAVKDKEDMYLEFFREVVRRTAQLVAAWQCVGFCHGVLNTDNMSILGLTLDYGPYGFMDTFNPHHVCNHSDDSGRYDYAAQPGVCRWNCEKLAEALAPVLPAGRSRAEVDVFDREFDRCYWATMRRKLGLLAADEGAADRALIEDLLQVMEDTGADFTNTFRRLALVPLPADSEPSSTAAPEQRAEAPNGAAAPRSNGALGHGQHPSTGSGAGSSGAGAQENGAPAGSNEGLGSGSGSGSGAAFLEATLAELAAPRELAAAAAPRMPAHNLRILAQVAAHDPLLLMAIGTTKEAAAAGLQRLQRTDARQVWKENPDPRPWKISLWVARRLWRRIFSACSAQKRWPTSARRARRQPTGRPGAAGWSAMARACSGRRARAATRRRASTPCVRPTPSSSCATGSRSRPLRRLRRATTARCGACSGCWSARSMRMLQSGWPRTRRRQQAARPAPRPACACRATTAPCLGRTRRCACRAHPRFSFLVLLLEKDPEPVPLPSQALACVRMPRYAGPMLEAHMALCVLCLPQPGNFPGLLRW